MLEIVQPAGAPAPIASIYSPDQGPEAMHADILTLSGNHLHLTLAALRLIYDATLTPNGQALRGTLTQGTTNPLELVRATGSALWIDPTSMAPPAWSP